MSELAIIGVLKDQLNLANQRCAQLEILLVREREDRNAVIAEATTELNVQIGFLEEKVKELEDEHSGLCGTLASRDTEIADLRQRLDGAIATTNHNFMSAERWKEEAIRQQGLGDSTAYDLQEALERCRHRIDTELCVPWVITGSVENGTDKEMTPSEVREIAHSISVEITSAIHKLYAPKDDENE